MDHIHHERGCGYAELAAWGFQRFQTIWHDAPVSYCKYTYSLIFTLFIIGFLFVVFILFAGSYRVDNQKIEDSRYYAELALQGLQDDLGVLAKDHSWWDEMIIHSVPRYDLQWVSKTYIPYLWDDLNISDLVVLDFSFGSSVSSVSVSGRTWQSWYNSMVWDL